MLVAAREDTSATLTVLKEVRPLSAASAVPFAFRHEYRFRRSP